MTNNQSQLTNEERAYLKAKMDRVMLLLDASIMPDVNKTAWLTLLPSMNLNQIDRLIDILEQELDKALEESKKHPEDEELIVKLKAAKERYDAQVATADKKLDVSLKDIEEKIA